MARGAYDAEARAVLSFREFEHILALEVLGPYHNEIHSALGRTPASAWTEGMAKVTLRSPANATVFLRDFLPFEERIVRRDGVAGPVSLIKMVGWLIWWTTARVG